MVELPGREESSHHHIPIIPEFSTQAIILVLEASINQRKIIYYSCLTHYSFNLVNVSNDYAK